MNARPLRIAYGRIAQESNALSPVLTQLDDFARTHLVRGRALAEACSAGGREVPAFLADAELSGFVRACVADGDTTPLPLVSAWAVPGGPVSRAALDALTGELCDRLRAALPVDGVMLSLHGAMAAEDSLEPEAEILAAVRAIVGPEVKIAVALDLHADLTPNKLRAIDVLAAYQTNPHRDHARTGERAGRQLIAALRGRTRLHSTWRSLPMVHGGGLTLDFLPPMLPIFWRLRTLERDKSSVLLANLFMSHLWLDSPELGWAVHVTTDGDAQRADEVADALADRLWAVRHQGPPQLPDAQAAIAEARAAKLARRLGAVVMCDASDVVGAGAPGDRSALLAAALEHGRDLRWLLPMRDPAAIEALSSARIGGEVALSVGGSLDPARSTPLPVRGTLRRFEATDSFGRVATLDLGPVQLVVTEGACLAMKPEFYADRGLDVWGADVIGVKSFFPFRLYFAKVLRKSIYVRTGGGTTDFDTVTAQRFARPTWPQMDPGDWRPADRARRQVEAMR